MSYSVPLFEILQIFFTDIQNAPHLKIKSYKKKWLKCNLEIFNTIKNIKSKLSKYI